MTTVPITRRAAIVAGCAVVGSARAWVAPAVAATAKTMDVNGESVKVARHVASGAGPRSTVLILHGSKGLDAHLPAYERYADDLAIAGMDALVFSYYGPGDLSAIDDASSASKREAIYARSIGRWMSVVRTVAKSAKERNPSSHVGLLGFSLGGFVAVAAASERLFSVVTTFYAGLPTFYGRPVSFLPPLLDIHGDADRAVPLSQPGHEAGRGGQKPRWGRGLGRVPERGPRFRPRSQKPGCPARETARHCLLSAMARRDRALSSEGSS